MACKQDSAAKKQFANFTRYISGWFIDKIDKRSYVTQESVRNRWRSDCEYSVAAEELLILKSRAYLRMLDSRESKSKNPSFLKALTNLMADYLSAYTMRSGTTRRQAEEALKKALYSENPYIQNMLAEQEQKRNQGNRTPTTVAAHRKQDAKIAAQKARDIRNQVMNEFAEVRTYARKR